MMTPINRVPSTSAPSAIDAVEAHETTNAPASSNFIINMKTTQDNGLPSDLDSQTNGIVMLISTIAEESLTDCADIILLLKDVISFEAYLAASVESGKYTAEEAAKIRSASDPKKVLIFDELAQEINQHLVDLRSLSPEAIAPIQSLCSQVRLLIHPDRT